MKTMSIFILVMAIATTSFAQQNEGQQGKQNEGQQRKGTQMEDQKKREMLQSHKVAYITQKLDLTPEEAEKFWPVYNKMNKEVESTHKAYRAKMKAAKEQEKELTDKQIEDLINEGFANEQKVLDIRKQYNDEIKKAIPIQKVAKLYRAERTFKKEMLKRRMMQHRSKQGGAMHRDSKHQGEPMNKKE